MKKNAGFIAFLFAIENNGVGFKEVYFRMNMSSECLYDERGEIEKKFMDSDMPLGNLVINFSDGDKLLASLNLTPKELDKTSEDSPSNMDGKHSIAITEIGKRVLGLDKTISIELFVNSVEGLMDNTAGTALIQFWPERPKKK